MIHNPLALTIGDYREHESRTETLRTMRDTLADIYESRSDMPKESILSKMDSETWFSAEKAVQHGFASKILVSTEPTASATSPQTILASRLKSSIIAQNFKNIPESLKTILNSDTDPVGDSSNGTPHNLPIISGATPAQSKGDSMDELNQFLASNPTAKAAHEKLIAEAKVPVASAPVTPVAEPVQPAAPVAQSPVANVSPEIVAKSNAYPEQIRAMAVACLVDPENITAVASFNAVIAMHDMNVAQASATAAATATAQTGETPPVAQAHGTPPVASAQNPAGLISDAESAKALFSTVKG